MIYVLVIAILVLLAESGCGALTSGYDNFATYFNAYYNARRIFREAESEIEENIRLSRPRMMNATNATLPTPGTTRTKLVSVIEKCSNILSFHPNSSYVENALFLIGRSYFYLEEYVKAERKFTELISQFADGSLADDAHLWLAKTELALNKLDEALRVSILAQDLSRRRGEEALVHQALLVGADVLLAQGYAARALELMERAEEIPLSGEAEALDLMKQGATYAVQSQFRSAIGAYQRVPEFTSDVFLVFKSKQELLSALRALGEYEAGLEVADNMRTDVRFQEFLPAIRLERALLVLGRGDTLNAIAELQQLDSSGQRTVVGAQAALTLGNHYEFDVGDYRLALHFYDRASAVPGFAQSDLAARRSEGLTKIVASARQWTEQSGMLTALRNSARISDSLGGDSARGDSLRTQLAITAAELGDIYFSELDRSDSADAWFARSIAIEPNSERAPRTLFVRAEIARTDSLRKETAITFYRQLATMFPQTPYGAEARRFLGLEQKQDSVDASGLLYERAEGMIETGRNKEALNILESIPASYPESKHLVQSEYAAAWLYEQRLDNHDSALARYTHIANEHPTTTFAAAARQKILEPGNAAATDSLGPSRNAGGADSLQQKPTDDDDILRNRNLRIKKSEPPELPVAKPKTKDD